MDNFFLRKKIKKIPQKKIVKLAGIEHGAVGSGRKHANHCAAETKNPEVTWSHKKYDSLFAAKSASPEATEKSSLSVFTLSDEAVMKNVW